MNGSIGLGSMTKVFIVASHWLIIIHWIKWIPWKVTIDAKEKTMDFTGIAMEVDEMTVVFNSMVAMQHWLKDPLVTNHLCNA